MMLRHPCALPRIWLFSIFSFVAAQAFAAEAAVPPAELFFSPANSVMPKLSPDGTKICLLTRIDDRHYGLAMIDLGTKKNELLAQTKNGSTVNFWWKNNDLLLILLSSDSGPREFRSLDLRNRKSNSLENLPYFGGLKLVNTLADDPEQMLFGITPASDLPNHLIKVNVRTGKTTKVESDPGGVVGWFTTRSGQPIAAWGKSGSHDYLLHRSNPTAKWQRDDFPDNKDAEMVFHGVAPDDRRLLVTNYRTASTGAVGYYDPETKAFEPIVPAQDVEISAAQSWTNLRAINAVAYETDHLIWRFLDPEVENSYRWLEEQTPGMEREPESFAKDRNLALIFFQSDRNPGVYAYVDFAEKKMQVVSRVDSTINPNEMAPGRHFRFRASDGLMINGRITLPRGSTGKVPLILMVGPSLDGPRSHPVFDSIAQFFASRGYATAHIDHRGIAGFGRDFRRAGNFETGRGIIRDLTEGVEWLAAQGWIDRSHMAVFGNLWGGVNAFQLALKPDLFRVLINFETPMDFASFAGTDILMFAMTRMSKDDAAAQLGGKKAVTSYLESISPLTAAERLKIPSFHHYTRYSFGGAQELRFSANRLETLLKKTGAPYEFLTSDSEERLREQNRVEWRERAKLFETLDVFLKKHL